MATNPSQPQTVQTFSVSGYPISSAPATYTPQATTYVAQTASQTQTQATASHAASPAPQTQSTVTSTTVPPSTQSQTQATASTFGASQAAQQSRQRLEEARKDRTLAEFMLMLDDYEPLVSVPLVCSCEAG